MSQYVFGAIIAGLVVCLVHQARQISECSKESEKSPVPPLPKLPPVTRPLILTVAGASGSGKSSLASRIQERLGTDRLVSLSSDSYYKSLPPKTDASTHDFDHPDSIDFELLATHLKQLKMGKSVEVPHYDFVTHKRLSTTTNITNPAIIVLDGILTLAVPEIRAISDIKIFTLEDLDTCLGRRVLRDTKERGREVADVLHQYQRFVKPGFKRFVEPSMVLADFILPNARDNTVAIETIVNDIVRRLKGISYADKDSAEAGGVTEETGSDESKTEL